MTCENHNFIKNGIRNSVQRFRCTRCGKSKTKEINMKMFHINKRPLSVEKGIVKRLIATPDKHFPLADYPACNVVKSAIETIRPDIYIDLGDFGEFSSVSHWENKKRSPIPLDYQLGEIDSEFKEINAGFDYFDESLDKANVKEKYFTTGNHENWIESFLGFNEHLRVKYGLLNAFKLEERGYQVLPFGEMLKIGKTYFYHGHQAGGVNHARSHLLKFGVNVIYGHHHDIQHYTINHVDGVKSATSIGCLKKLDAESNSWLNHLAHRWAHGFAIIDYFEDGLFTINVVTIVDGKASIYGELYNGNKTEVITY